MAPKIQGLFILGQKGVGRMPYFEVVGFKGSLDSNGDRRIEREVWRRKVKAPDAELSRVKGEKWMRYNFLKSHIDNYRIETRPMPIRKRPIISIQRPSVCRVARDAI